jgi:uncharacterized protein YfaS (alpha-2-macroglobulin family)/tetratricopeptide (TPR) repeat protein
LFISTAFLAALSLAMTVAGNAQETKKSDPAKASADKPDAKSGDKSDGKVPVPVITSLPRIPATIHDSLQSRDFAEAVKRIDAELKTGKATAPDYLLYLKGRAQTELANYDDATATFNTLEKEHAKSVWATRARFGRADILSRQRDYRAAAELRRVEAERLLSAGRRDELTNVILEFADRYFEGVPAKDPSQKKHPDYAQALSWYQEALKLQPGLALRQKIEYRIARSHQELAQHNEALTAFNNWLQRYASEKAAKADRVPAAMEAEARYQYGRTQLAAGQPAEARKTWQDFLTSPAAKQAGGELVAEASYRLAGTYGIPQPGSIGDLELGVAALEKFLKAYPKHKLAAKAELEIAQSYAHHARYDQAIARLKAFLANEAYAKADEIAEARRLLGQSSFNQKRFPEAITAWKEFLEKHPNNAAWSTVQQQVVDSEYQIAAEHARKKQYSEARTAWETFLNKYPLDPRAAGILFRFGQMKYAAAVELRDKAAKAAQGAAKAEALPAAQKPLPDEAKTLFEEALADWQRLVSKYPNTNEASQAAHSIGITLEDQLGRLPEALEAYNKVTGQQQAAAKQRVANLTAKQLEVVTERKFRSNDKPEIVVHTRNVEAVQVKLYRVDMLDYFRKMHLATGVESLDVALIDPDKTVDHSVAGYEKYRRHENRIVLPLDGPGVTAVTVTGEKLEATTMIVVSDLDLIVKSSRNELFVFVQNMLTGKPADGVSLLISDGATVFSEATTNKDGVLQKSYEELKTIEDLRVFAAQDGHSASSVVGLNGLDFAVGLAAKGSLWTDRPAYRAGQLVNIKGVVRWVENDRYTFKPGEKYQLDVYDPRGRVLHSAKATLGEFGTFAANLTLPDSVPQGDCRVHLHQPGKDQSYETTFQVHEFKLEPIHLTIDLKQKVFYRGEKVTGTIKLAYYYGAPLAGRTVQFRLADDRLFTETTNDKGEVPFSFDTARYSESQPLILSVQHPERNLTAQETVYLATRGFVVSVSTQRPVFIAGETFDVTASVADPSSKPVETALKLEVFEETRLHGERGERLVATHDLKSDDKGKARQTLKLETAGRYLLRTTGIDRFGNPVSGQTAVQISGDDDKVRLRILSSQHLYKVGDTAKVEIHWREAPALALVTSEGARILGYRLVALKTGSNTLDLPIDTTLAPNFELAVAVMEKNRFHQARSGFLVTRRLNIALKPSAATLKPGDELKVDVTATDPQGKPVSAEISLGLIQRNILDIFADTQGNLEEFFSGGVRTVSMRAATSCTFRYEPRTRGVSEALLAEADRVEVRELERKSREELKQELAKEVDHMKVDVATNGRLPRPSRRIPYKELKDSRDELLESDLDGVEENFWKQLDDVEQAAIAGVTDGQQLDFGNAQQWKDLTARRRTILLNSMPLARIQTGPMVDGPGPGQLNMQMFARPQGPAGLRSHTTRNLTEIAGNSSGSGVAHEYSNGVQLPSAYYLRDDLQYFANSPLGGENRLGWGAFGTGKNGSVDGNGEVWHFAPSGRVQLSLPGLQTDGGKRFLDELRDFDGTVLGVNNRGEFQVINGLTAAAVQQMAKDGLEILPGQASSETGYWNPVIVTDKEGKAQVTFRLPDRSTAWKLRAKGIDQGTLAGQAEAELITKKDLFAEIKTPLAFVAGDKAQVMIEIHNSVVEKDAKIEVVLKITQGEKTATETRTLVSKGPGIEERLFPIEVAAADADAVSLELTVSSGDRKDLASVNVPVRPHGMDVFATAAGRAAQNTIAFVEFDAKLNVQRPRLEIVLGPSVNRTLLDAVLGSNPLACELTFPSPRGGLERAVSDVLGGVVLLKTIRESAAPDSPEAQTLAARINGGVAQLVSSQREDGSWNWAARAENVKPDRYLTSRVMWALAEARRGGFAVPQATFDKGVQALNTAFTQSVQTDREGQAILLHGLAEAGAADFAFANRLYRDRNTLSTSGLLHVALVLARLDRKEMAVEMLKLVNLPAKPAAVDAAAKAAAPDAKLIPWMQSNVELRALYLLALQEIEPASTKSSDLADAILAQRTGSRWSPEKANGPAVAALARWFARTKFTPEKYTLSVFVNEKLVEKIDVDPSKDASRRIAVAERFLVAGKPQKVNFDIEGRGNFSYACVLTGFVAAENLKSTTNDWHVKRQYEPAQRMLDGQVIPRGFGILSGGYNTFHNPLTQLPLGERGEVTLNIWRSNWKGTPDEQVDYLIVTEPIPAGTMVLTESITGNFERYELSPGFITFYLGDKQYGGDIRYALTGYLPGDYKAGPTLVRSFYRPERMAVAERKQLAVLARGEKSKDEYKLSPVELFEFGKRLAAKGDYKGADEHLTKLFRDYRLDPSPYQETVKLLFKTSLELGRKDAIVEYFEIIKEKYPDVEIDYESILKVARSYQDLGEYERSFLVYRATVEASFDREGKLSGFLDGQGQFVRSVAVMERILREYPAEAYVAIATYALAQEVFGKASEAANIPALREAHVTRVDLIAANIHMLDHFLSTWPKDPAADQASFALANSHLELEQFDAAIARCRKSAERYPDSKLLDSFWYIIGFSQFALGQSDDALATCKKVAEMKSKDPGTGIELAAANREQAIYIMGQVFHSLGKPAQAIGEYERVKSKFPDALEAIDFFTRKDIKLPEVTTIKPGDPAKVAIDFRNLPEASVKVYRIDLLKFGLMQRNLDRITAINLAGIRPYHEQTLALGDGKDFRDRKQDLTLPLKEEGAYLVVCRAENLYASGLVLVSPLVIEPQEEAQQGRVRVTMKDVVADKYVPNVHVKVIGTRNSQFTAGESDLRGVFTADGIQGTATVIARSVQNRYAFYRGKTDLGQPAPAKAPADEKSGESKQELQLINPNGNGILLDNVIRQNTIFNNEQRGNYKGLQQKDNSGVKAKAAF